MDNIVLKERVTFVLDGKNEECYALVWVKLRRRRRFEEDVVIGSGKGGVWLMRVLEQSNPRLARRDVGFRYLGAYVNLIN